MNVAHSQGGAEAARRYREKMREKWKTPNVQPAIKITQYFRVIRTRQDRAAIRDEWIERAIHNLIQERVQADGRIRRWAKIEEMDGRYLRVILLSDSETVHNAFFDRNFKL